MARVMRAGADRKPKVMRVSSRILVLTDSISALDRRCSSAAWILSRTAAGEAGEADEAGMRQRRVQDSHRSRAVLPASPLAMKT